MNNQHSCDYGSIVQGTMKASLPGTEERSTPSIVNKAKLDLVVLQYMARRVNMALTLHYQAADAAGPLLYYAKERRKRTHRIAIYQPDELFQNTDIAFVGFISGKRLSTNPAVIDEIHAIDTKMIVELMNTPGILSYSSLELRDGNWCNLVLLSDLAAKIHVKNSDTHKYAAYDLAPHYYEWIRLHNGVIPDGIGSNRLIQYKVRHYLFHGDDGRPLIREQRYNNM